MRSLEGLNLVPVWLNPDHMVATARILLAGHRLKVLAIVDGSDLVGVVTAAQIGEAADTAHVRDLMRRPDRLVDVATPIRQLAESFWQEDLEYVAVTQNGRFRGIVTANLLLKEMARSWDPLTGLSWSDRLREWGVENLRAGREITILFVDLDDFGSYNKKYGHIVGDRVLQKVADMMEETVDPELDLLVRYGGDEFAIGSLRDQAGSLALAQTLRESMSRLRVAGSDESVSFSVGVQGGKRTKERESVHYAATLDNLINLASKNSMAEKTTKKSMAAPPRPPEATAPSGPELRLEEVSSETAADLAEAQQESPARPEPTAEVETAQTVVVEESASEYPVVVAEVTADAANANSVTQVLITKGDRAVVGIAPRKGGSVIKSVSLATANAISQIDPEAALEIHEVNLTESDTGVRFISVIGACRIDGEVAAVGGVGTVGRNLYVTVAEATLQAYTNLGRQI